MKYVDKQIRSKGARGNLFYVWIERFVSSLSWSLNLEDDTVVEKFMSVKRWRRWQTKITSYFSADAIQGVELDGGGEV